MNDERDDMLMKRQLDQLPRDIAPPADLWPSVRSRIGGAKVVALPVKRPWQRLRVAALLGLLGASAAAWGLVRQRSLAWEMAGAKVPVGATLAGAGRVDIGTIGHVDLGASALARHVKSSGTEHRLALARGSLHAEISAPPRLFVVETPSGTAVDLGCAYDLVVDSAGNSTIRVTAGWVSFENGPVVSLIPAGMSAAARRGSIWIGMPVRDDAGPELKDAVRAYDAAPSDASLGAILRSVDRRDAVTLWHLVQRTEGEARGRVITKLVSLVPLPEGVARVDIERAEPHAMELYWTALPGTLPIIPSWQQTLWKLWLKVGL